MSLNMVKKSTSNFLIYENRRRTITTISMINSIFLISSILCDITISGW